MSRLIDADALERAVMFTGEDSICNDCAYEFVNLIDEQPTIEAEPVRRGKWMPDDEKYQCGWVCNRCFGKACRSHKFCPHCGAKMEEE